MLVTLEGHQYHLLISPQPPRAKCYICSVKYLSAKNRYQGRQDKSLKTYKFEIIADKYTILNES